MSVKYSKRFERDYLFYLSNREKFWFAGIQPFTLSHDEDGPDAKEAFFYWDSQGKIIPTSEPDLLQSLMLCKKSVNFHIKMWAEGYQECLITISEYLEGFIDPPAWVEKALRQQINRRYGSVEFSYLKEGRLAERPNAPGC